MTNPRNAGRKPKLQHEKNQVISITLPPELIAKIDALGGRSKTIQKILIEALG